MDKTSGVTGTKYEQNTTQQVALLGALQQTSDPKKLKEMIGVKTVAEVYRTLDKLAIRREFHKALTDAGISFEFIINGIKREAIGGDKSADRLKAFEMMLKTLGLDKYDDTQTASATSWEEKLLAAMDSAPPLPDKEDILSLPGEAVQIAQDEYEVLVPQIPQAALEKEKEDEKMSKSLLSDDFPRPKS